jgi:restriction system protein
MKNYYRVILGAQNKFANTAFQEGFIGVGFLPNLDLTNQFPENWREFNKKFVPIFLKEYIGKSKVAAGLSCATIWTIGRGVKIGDIV